MKNFLLVLTFFFSIASSAQYYYKDIIGAKETSEMIKAYKANNVKKVLLTSYDADGTKSEGFYVEQIFNPATQTLRTVTRSGITGESILTSYTDAQGNVIKTIDTTGSLVSITTYNYANGLLTSIVSTSSDSSKAFKQVEEHKWEYANGKILRMLRIKNNIDTTVVQFKLDDAGNIIEEQTVRKGGKSDPVYYYYDSNNRLTDIVRFNNKVRRLLPEYLFEYSANNQVIQKITVPATGSNYLIWRYQYDNNGLKIKEAVYNKQKELTGKIEYYYLKG